MRLGQAWAPSHTTQVLCSQPLSVRPLSKEGIVNATDGNKPPRAPAHSKGSHVFT